MIYDVELETLPREDLEKLQLSRLQTLVQRVCANVPFYRDRFKEHGISPSDIRGLSDLKKLPFTEKQNPG